MLVDGSGPYLRAEPLNFLDNTPDILLSAHDAADQNWPVPPQLDHKA